ncbi:MAG: PadR family transcriptional regulator [Hyphomicrobiales bacterium]|nr:MAG: PadR family transcriptional regulator [Hyphomicrobiales bacterium]
MHHHHNDQRWDHNWRRFEAMARRGFGRIPGMGRGDWGGFGGNFRIGRMLASGDLRLVALFLIEQQPRHGYDLIKAIEEKSAGFYSPSPGIVYPALTFLEEAGYVTSNTEGNKKLYTITEEGRAHLADNRQAIEATLDFLGKAGEKMNAWRDMMRERPQDDAGDTQGPHRGHWPFGHHEDAPPRPDRDIRDVLPEVNEARRELKAALADAVRLGAESQRRVADILRKAAADIRAGAQDEDDIDL